MNGPIAMTGWWRECVTEAVKVTTVRRNMLLGFVAVVVAVAGPWLFLAGFGALRGDGVGGTSIEVVALAQRNQTVALALMVVLGLQAYLSDAANGLLAGRLAVGRGWSVPGGKLLFGAVASVGLAVAASASAVIACLLIGLPEPGPAALGPWTFWMVSTLVLAATLLLHFELGLLFALATRHKGVALAAGLMVPFVLLSIVRGVLRSLSPDAAAMVDWVVPTELASALLAWVPAGNSLMDSPAGGLGMRAALLVCWLAVGAVVWLTVMRRRPLYPADQG